ncbi:hypothetical protein DSO57_1031558 [Entomophthora muscae]|uniref:Uncharacterized protein n=1 Tax=Entomophthora muscae TaxID=34485 RepID=A0ACC2SPT9_9FUNG|nr:hypothetical protein DSO57_1031558 [Entomophthora muscae]
MGSTESSGDTTSTGIDPNYKPTFKQLFNPNISIITACLAIYQNAMRCTPDKLKQEHILLYLHPIFQEVVVPELASINSWSQMKEMLIAKFVTDLSLEVKKDAFICFAFKPKETLTEFTDFLYI